MGSTGVVTADPLPRPPHDPERRGRAELGPPADLVDQFAAAGLAAQPDLLVHAHPDQRVGVGRRVEVDAADRAPPASPAASRRRRADRRRPSRSVPGRPRRRSPRARSVRRQAPLQRTPHVGRDGQRFPRYLAPCVPDHCVARGAQGQVTPAVCPHACMRGVCRRPVELGDDALSRPQRVDRQPRDCRVDARSRQLGGLAER